MPDPSNSGVEIARVNALEAQVARLDPKVSHLESRMERSEGKMDNIADRLARLEERVSHLPTKETIVRIALGTLAFLTAVTVLQSKIQALLGLSR